MPDAIHTNLADIQTALTTACTAESPDGSVRAEATARTQLALHLSSSALKMAPTALAALILATQQEAQANAEAALTEALDTYRADPRVATTLETLRDTQASPPPPPKTGAREDDDADFVGSVYNSDSEW